MRIRVAHISLQFSDTNAQHEADINKIFSRAMDRRYAWITGTEAGPGAGNTSELLVSVGREAGYKMYVPSIREHGPGSSTDAWIGVREDLVKGGWKAGFTPVIPGSKELYEKAGVNEEFPKWGPKGLVHVEFDSLPQVGHVSVCAAHHLTKGVVKGSASVIHKVDHYEWNQKFDAVISKWAAEQAKGSALAFGAMDRNGSDRRMDSIPGTTTLADELKKWQNTGHGDIDWIFSVNKDGRVTGVNYVVLDDKEFSLHGDHYLLEGTYEVASRRSKI